ncbi:hypothetical protein P0W64_16785 [Tsukamurella sp. 8F]|uniref:hypothetical protein n=1 Tax=unclassified Tsukamurella TaxID=2633480 RepID=UPI0023B89409|nr:MULTISPECIES: hypothetical protein [unclassified Tsukamurella]MDF0532456.1 hypothetical protein [Tsukamurella sp. 8J]MDF0588439.1 hypothetical protein [Tsukamurella sp. 8F]
MTITSDPRPGARAASPRRADRTRDGRSRTRSAAAQRAIERRDRRRQAQDAAAASGRFVRETPSERALRRHREGGYSARRIVARIPSAPAAMARRVPFMVGVCLLVAAGLALTLWLSTGSAEKAYALGRQSDINQALTERRAGLERDVKAGESAPDLAERATQLGMVPAGDLPVLMQGARGKVKVVGTPKPATGTAPAPLNAPPAGGTPTGPNPGQPRSGGEQLVTMNSGTPAVPNTAAPANGTPSPAPTTQAQPGPQAQQPQAQQGRPQAQQTQTQQTQAPQGAR